MNGYKYIYLKEKKMLNNSPWLWNARQTAAGLTARISLGIRILQGRRAKGQSNPSPEYVQNQAVAGFLWPVFRQIAGQVRPGFTDLQPGQSAANVWFQENRDNAFDLSSPPAATFTPATFSIGRGVITPTAITTPAADVSSSIVTVNFSTTPADQSQSADDRVLLVIYNPTTDRWAVQNTGPATRADGIASVSPLPAGFMSAGDTINIYVAFVGGPTGNYPGKSSTSVRTTVVATA